VITLSWTNHAKAKMMFYRLSPSRVRRVINTPKRIEEGVAPKTIAMMQPTAMKETGRGREAWTQEIWVMVQDVGHNRKVISAWRYPGVTKPRDAVTIDLMKKEYRAFMANGTIKS
jgi:hypothetical protein